MEKSKILIFFHLIRHSFVMTPSPQGEGFEVAFLKNVGEDIIFPKNNKNCAHLLFIHRAQSLWQKIKSHVKHNLTPLSAFSLTQKAQRKRLGKKKRRFMGSAQTRKLLKKLDQNFPAWVQREHLLLIHRAQSLWQKNKTLRGELFERGAGKTFLPKKVFPAK